MTQTLKWGGTGKTSVHKKRFMERTMGSGTSFPTNWPPNAFFFREDQATLYQNTGTLAVPMWTSMLTSDTTFAGLILALTP